MGDGASTRVEEVSVAPVVRAQVEPSVWAGVAVNRALADALAITHRVEHVVRVPTGVRDERAPRASGAESATPPHLGPDGIAIAGARVARHAPLVDAAGLPALHFAHADDAIVERVARVHEGLAPGIAEEIVVVVSWPGPLTIGDLLVAQGGGTLGVVTAIVDDGAPDPRLFVPGESQGGAREVTRSLPTARQILRARGIGPYSLVTTRPLAGERISLGQLGWLASRGCLALFNDFVMIKSDAPRLRTRAYESVVLGKAVEDPWAERLADEAAARATSPSSPTPSAPSPARPGSEPARDIFSFFERPRPDDAPTESYRLVKSLLRVAGVDLSLEGRTVRAKPWVPGDGREWSRGAVTKPETIHFRTHAPEPGGLFCQRVFGPVRDYQCACGKYARMKHRGIVCEVCGVEVIGSRVRRERFGHVELPEPVVPAPLQPLLGALLGEDAEALLASMTRDGGHEVAGRLAEVDLDARLAATREDDANHEWLTAFRGSGLAPIDVLWRVVPVLPPDLRPLIPLEGGRFATSDLNDLYRRVINRANRLRRLLELAAPATILENERRLTQAAVDQLLLNVGRGAIRGPNERSLLSVVPWACELLSGQNGRRVDYSGAAVVIVEPQAARAAVPHAILRELARPILFARVEARGLASSIREAKARLDGDPVLQRELVDEVFADRPLLFASAAENGPDGFVACAVTRGEDPVIRLPPAAASRLRVETGGEVAVHMTIGDRALDEARWLAAAGDTGILHPVDLDADSLLASLPDNPARAITRLALAALRGETDAGLRPAIALLLGGYELPEPSLA